MSITNIPRSTLYNEPRKKALQMIEEPVITSISP